MRPAAASLLPAGGREFDQARAELLAAVLAPDVADMVVLTIDGPPASKRRTRSGNGRVYKVDEAAEAATGWRLRRAFPKPWRGNLAVGLVFFRPNAVGIDADNMLKHVCDAGNGIAWVDDSQITAQYTVTELDRDDPRTLVVVTRHVSSLDRSGVGLRRRGGA